MIDQLNRRDLQLFDSGGSIEGTDSVFNNAQINVSIHSYGVSEPFANLADRSVAGLSPGTVTAVSLRDLRSSPRPERR
ncbi:hypothetical protein MITS9509_01054 [Synechococcus sp. MIT S9509]|nr:hypothetical protein MITS9504_00618 [Synechococcus sp. MIT S9504]KZR92605.1 hypothetical protein MITS9509_01054 [Synechococcus sp. MIT S9509]